MSTVTSLIIPDSPAEAAAKIIWEQLGSLPDTDLEVFHNQVVVVKFIRTTVGSSGLLHAAPVTKTEDKWQGKAGLVVKLGPSAFVDEPGYSFHGKKVNVNEWALYRNTDGYDMDFTPKNSNEKIHLRFLEDAHIKGRTTRPEAFW